MPAEVIGERLVTTTSKYADEVSVALFYGTSYEKSYNLTGIQDSPVAERNGKEIINTTGIPEGNYWPGSQPGHKWDQQTSDVSYKLVNLAIADVSITGYWNLARSAGYLW